mmetsp:Transcript_75100/g.150964  ORF Transcript_75100/g.150964 Transcript_75100/m.150964 type:complete len:173 (+) Transcript_75100:25-543(+)
MANIKRDVDPVSGPLMEEMSIFAMKIQVKELLAEYLRRVLLEKPEDVVGYLVDEIKRNPYTPPVVENQPDGRSEEDKAKFLDLRRDETKMDLLREIFDRFDPRGTGKVSRSKVLVAFKTEKNILLEKFQKHVVELPRAVERMECGNKEGLVDWPTFSGHLMTCLAGPGGLEP